VLGTLVTVSSIGAGAIGATVLVMLYPRLTAAEVAGTDIAYAVPLTAIAAVGHWWLGSIDWTLLLTLLVGSVPGITLAPTPPAPCPNACCAAFWRSLWWPWPSSWYIAESHNE
jgi:uncharacterized membrane protein YfcA